MSERRRYSDVERAEALALVADAGLAVASRKTGIPKTTLSGWAKVSGVRTYGGEKTRAATEASVERAKGLRELLKVRLLEKAVDLLGRMDSPHVDFKGKDADQVTYPIAPAAAVQNYATSVGILIDKYRLESGEATSLSGEAIVTFDDHESIAIAELARAELRRRAEATDVVE